MEGGLPSAPAPKLVVAEYRPELVALLRPCMVALTVQANLFEHATQIAVQWTMVGLITPLLHFANLGARSYGTHGRNDARILNALAVRNVVP